MSSTLLSARVTNTSKASLFPQRAYILIGLVHQSGSVLSIEHTKAKNSAWSQGTPSQQI